MYLAVYQPSLDAIDPLPPMPHIQRQAGVQAERSQLQHAQLLPPAADLPWFEEKQPERRTRRWRRPWRWLCCLLSSQPREQEEKSEDLKPKKKVSKTATGLPERLF